MAEAEAYAAKIAAHSRIEVSEIERRGLERLVREEGKKQANIESISRMAIEHLKPGAKPENIADDWLVHFFERARIVSDRDMQALWARILAGEANAAGGFSRRTVEFVGILDKKDAELFTKLCGFNVSIDGPAPTPIIWGCELPFYKGHGMTFTRLNHLDDIGLISFTPGKTYTWKCFENEVVISYFGDTFTIQNIPQGLLNVGECLLTFIGYELASICSAMRIDDFYSYLLILLSDQGHAPYCPVPTARRQVVDR
jgi:hypothetical protein